MEQETGREKQVVVQSERLEKAVEALKEVTGRFEACLIAVLNPKRTDVEKMGIPQKSFCTHGDFLCSKVSDINKVNRELNELIKRLEI